MFAGSVSKAQDLEVGATRRDRRRVPGRSTTWAQRALTAGTWMKSLEVASRRLSARDLSDRRGLGREGGPDGN